jgi:hypothetical protein
MAGAAACGTEPSKVEPGVYRLVAADSATTTTLACFASSSHYSGGELVGQADCDVALRSFEARFDSTGPVPVLRLTARVRLQSGDTTTWQVGLPATVQHSAIQYDFTTVTEPLTDEQVFILPPAGTLVNRVLTLLMTEYTATGLPERTDYARKDPSVFILTANGRPPPPSSLAPHYAGVSFSGQPAEYCTVPTATLPSRCFHRAFSLSSSGISWMVTYDELVTAEADTLGGMSVTASDLTVFHPNAFVRVFAPGPSPPNTPGALRRFEAQGSIVGGTLTLFTAYSSLDGSPLVSPIVANAE